MASALPDGTDIEDQVFTDLDLDEAILDGRAFTDCRFVNCSLKSATARDCRFDDCEFDGCDMTMLVVSNSAFHDVAFVRCKLMGVDWTAARQVLFDASFRKCVLSYGNCAGMTLRDIAIVDCTAVEVDFSDAKIVDADFAGTDLSGAVFAATRIEDTDLSLATGYAIDPRENRLRDVQFSLDGALRTLALQGITVLAPSSE